jgi:hypothetical protein
MSGDFCRHHYLPNDRGLAHLPGACHYLHKAAPFFQPFQQFVVDGLTYHTDYSMH